MVVVVPLVLLPMLQGVGAQERSGGTAMASDELVNLAAEQMLQLQKKATELSAALNGDKSELMNLHITISLGHSAWLDDAIALLRRIHATQQEEREVLLCIRALSKLTSPQPRAQGAPFVDSSPRPD